MNVLTILMLFIASANLSDSDEVIIKSSLSADQTKMYLKISLPTASEVSFTLVDESGDSKHHWVAQSLPRGRHQLALPMPLISQGDYSLKIEVGKKAYNQLVYVRG